MISGRIILCIANSWDYDPTSKHHLMKILSRTNDVVWIDYHGTRRPELSGADLRAGWHVLRRCARGIRRVNPSILQVTPLVIPGVTSRPLRKLHELMLIAQIRRAIRSVDGWQDKPLQIWSFAPDVPFLAGQFEEECFVYYCVDEYSQFEGIDAERVRAAEHELLDRADVVVTTSEPLRKTKGARRPDVALVRHGVDYDHFASAWRSPPPPPKDLDSVPRPIFGFFGLIQFWVDSTLIAEVAARRPDYSFVLIGDCVVNVPVLKRLPNVFLLGRRSYQHLPAYCAAFDAGLMPFTRSAMTRNVNPIKMHEYLAAGLPVISTSLPEAERFPGPITIADTAEGFAEACDQVLAAAHPGRRRAISKIVERESWRSKVEYLSELILNRLRGPIRTASMPADQVVGGGQAAGEGVEVEATAPEWGP